MTAGPLAGIRVVEFVGIGPGPCSGMMFADMGAEVIAINRIRHDVSTSTESQVDEAWFYGRGKKSICIDLKKQQGVELALELIATADVLIEGFRPGVMERLGLGPDVCLERQPALVYGRMTGWGQTGPMANAAGHDPNYLSVSGALWYGGREGRAPVAPTTVVGDVGGGTMVLNWGLMCALIHAQQSGRGQVVDAAITDGSAYISSLLWMMRNDGQIHDEFGTGWADGAAPWSETYECSDGKFVTVCALEPKFYRELIDRLGLSDDEIFSDQWNDSLWREGKKKLRAIFASKTRDEWCELLEGTDACFGPVLNFAEALKHPHNIARQTFVNVDGMAQPSPAPKFSVSKPKAGRRPRRGEHTEELLHSAGYSAEKISALRIAHVI